MPEALKNKNSLKRQETDGIEDEIGQVKYNRQQTDIVEDEIPDLPHKPSSITEAIEEELEFGTNHQR